MIETIRTFAKSGFWDYKHLFVPIISYAPVISESFILVKAIYDRSIVKQQELHYEAGKTFSRFATEPKSKVNNRKIFRCTAPVLLGVTVAGVSAYASFYWLPASIASTTALTSLFWSINLAAKANSFPAQIRQTITRWPQEEKGAYRKRMTLLFIKTLLLLPMLSTGSIIGTCVLKSLITKGFSWQFDLPYQTKAVVFLEYAFIGALHGQIAYSRFKRGDKINCLFHLFASALSFAFPLHYWNREMRLHHSSYGLLLMALPFRSARFLGSVITFDSALYFLENRRGYYSKRSFVSYDLINSLLPHFPRLFKNYNASFIFQKLSQDLSSLDRPLNTSTIEPDSPLTAH